MPHTPFLTSVPVDGDTIRHHVSLDFYTRLDGIDTPEMSDHKQRPAAQVVLGAVRQWLARHRVLVDLNQIRFDKYGGRLDNDLYGFDPAVKLPSLTDYLLLQQLGRPYDGGPKPPWTQEQLKHIEAWKPCAS